MQVIKNKQMTSLGVTANFALFSSKNKRKETEKAIASPAP